jgi:quercetin dioxygenase-like cupin family protein
MIVAGAGPVRLEDGEHTLEPGDVLSIASNEPHAILGRGLRNLRFVCLDSLTG